MEPAAPRGTPQQRLLIVGSEVQFEAVETDPGVISLADPYNNKPLAAVPVPAVPAAKPPAAPAAPATAAATTKPEIPPSFSAFHRAFYNPGKGKDADSSTPENPYQWA